MTSLNITYNEPATNDWMANHFVGPIRTASSPAIRSESALSTAAPNGERGRANARRKTEHFLFYFILGDLLLASGRLPFLVHRPIVILNE